jgi:hypothetical protein
VLERHGFDGGADDAVRASSVGRIIGNVIGAVDSARVERA